MRQPRILGVAVAVLAFAVAASSATAADRANGKKHKGHHVHGKVTKLDKDSFTVTVTEHHKKNAAATAAAQPPAAPVETTFKVTAETKFFKAPAEKGGEKLPATFADLKDGEHVAVAASEDGVAKEVTIHAHHHNKKKPAA